MAASISPRPPPPPPAGQRGSTSRLSRLEAWLFATVVVAMTIVAVLPRYPAMIDASSHIATAWIAHRLMEGDPFLAAHYAFDPILVPYWATTLILTPLLAWLHPLAAFDVLLAMYCLALPLAYLWLLRVAAPQNTPWAVVAALAVFNTGWWYGETNFFLGLPASLAGMALFLGLRRSRPGRWAAFVAVAIFLYLSHIFGLVALLAPMGMLGLVDLAGRLRSGGAPAAARVPAGVRLGPSQWWAMALVAGLFLLAAWNVLFAHGTSANQGTLVMGFTLDRLTDTVTYPFRLHTRDGRPSALLFAAVLAVLWAGPAVGALRRGRRPSELVNPAMLWPAVGLSLLAYVGPLGVQEDFGLEQIAERFLVSAPLFLLGAVRFTGSRRWRASLAVVVVLFSVLRVGDALHVGRRHDAAMIPLQERIIGRVEPGSRVLSLMDFEEEPDNLEYSLMRLGNWVVTERRGYSPHVFARTGQQPLRHLLRDDYRVLRDLTVTAAEWALYDYVLVQTDRVTPRIDGLGEHARRVASEGQFQLYEVVEPGEGGAAAEPSPLPSGLLAPAADPGGTQAR